MTRNEFFELTKDKKKFNNLAKVYTKYEEWRKTALEKLLTVYPKKVYEYNSGFKYAEIETLGGLLKALAKPIQLSGNHCDKIESQIETMMLNEVIYEVFVETFDK